MTSEAPVRPATIVVAAAVQALEGGVVLGLGGYTLWTIVSGESEAAGFGLGVILFEVAIGAAMLAVAWGLLTMRRWSRAPALLVQLFAGIVGFSMINEGRAIWGTTLIILAVVAVASLLSPPSTRVLAPEDKA